MFMSMISARKVISNIDQLIYQALLKDKPVVLNLDNVVKIKNHNYHAISEGLSLVVQPISDELFTDINDILLVDIKGVEHLNIHKWCTVEGSQMSMSKETGCTKTFNLRVLDENLNPFKINA